MKFQSPELNMIQLLSRPFQICKFVNHIEKCMKMFLNYSLDNFKLYYPRKFNKEIRKSINNMINNFLNKRQINFILYSTNFMFMTNK